MGGGVHAELKLLCGGTKHSWTKQYLGKENVVSVVQLKINIFQYTQSQVIESS